MCRMGSTGRGLVVLAAVAVAVFAGRAQAQIDTSRYMAPDQLRRGMKGFGRTVMAGTEIQTFDFEVISVMKNAWYAGQDVILVRCSGLNLEHSGIIGGMSGSPCYVRDDEGRERMIGAIAYGWSFSKDPICGVQPVTQMLPIQGLRDPQNQPVPASGPAKSDIERSAAPPGSGSGLSLGGVYARAWGEPVHADSRFSIFNTDSPADWSHVDSPPPADQLRPLAVPVMVSGATGRHVGRLAERFEQLGLTLVASGAAGGADAPAAGVQLEPGSVLCVALMTGDMNMQALGTCTEVVGDRVLGFGHSLFGKGSVELPLATGMVHTVIPSVMRSNKLGAALETVGTLWGDETTGVFGIRGKAPSLTDVEVTLRDVRAERTYRYQVARDRQITALLLNMALSESIYAHNSLPDEHTVRYSIQVDFEGLGTFRTDNFTSQVGSMGVEMDLLFPVLAITNTPYGDVKITRTKVDVSIEPTARQAQIDRIQLPRTVYKPGETIAAHVRWFHYRGQPAYTESVYRLTLPADLRDGEYDLAIGGVEVHLSALRQEKSYLWRVEKLSEILSTLNLVGSFPEDRLYMRLTLPDGGLAVGRVEMPELPSFRQKIVADAKRGDVEPYREALVTQHETGFAVRGGQTFKIKVQQRDDY